MDIKSIKERGRNAFKANYWPCVLAALILTIVLGAVTAAGGNSVNNSASDAAAEMQTLSDQLSSLTPEELTVVVASVAAVIAVNMILDKKGVPVVYAEGMEERAALYKELKAGKIDLLE